MTRRRSILLMLVAAGTFLGKPGLASGQMRQTPVLNPKTYRSPSGRFVLTVDPTERFGGGAGRYRLTNTADGVVAWSGERPFTFTNASVEEDGTVEGCGCSLGTDVSGEGHLGDFLIVCLDARGQIRWQQKVARYRPPEMHASPAPSWADLIVDRSRDRLIVQTTESFWRLYRYSSGTPLGETSATGLPPGATKYPSTLHRDACRFLPESGLMLMQWRGYWANRAPYHARFALIDPLPPGKAVWTLDVPPQPKPSEQDDAPAPVLDAILPSEAPGTFSLWLAEDGTRADYAVEATPGRVSWQVRETGRHPSPAPVPVPPEEAVPDSPTLPEGTLAELGQFTLQEPAGKALPAIRSVQEFGFDDQGHAGFLRGEPGRSAFVLVEAEHGAVLREVDLAELSRPGGKLSLAWVGPGGRWLITVSDESEKTGTQGWLIEANTGVLTPLTGLDYPPVQSLAGAGDGWFAVLSRRPDQLVGYGPDGRRRWTVKGTYETFFSPDEITVLDRADGTRAVAAVEAVGNHVGFFDLASGRLLDRLDLNKVWGHEAGYTCGISPDEDGGFVVENFRSSPPYVRMTAEGTVRAEMVPQGADDQPLDGITMRYDPVGKRIWTTDRNSLLRLDPDGHLVDLTLGAPPGDERLGEIGGITVDDRGRVYAADRRTGTVHVFDAAGAPIRRLHRLPADTSPDDHGLDDLAVAPDGRVFAGFSYDWRHSREGQRVEFAADDGRRLGSRSLGITQSPQRWLFPGGGKAGALLVLGDGEVLLTGLEAGQQPAASRTISRQPDGCWLERLDGGGFGPDNSFAVISVPGDSYAHTSRTVNVFAADGKPRRTFTLAPEFDCFCFAYNGKYFVTCKGDQLALFEAGTGEGKLTFTPRMPAGLSLKRGGWQFFSVHGGRELWLVESTTRTVAKFAWPE